MGGSMLNCGFAFGLLAAVCLPTYESAQADIFSGRFDPSHGRLIAVDGDRFLWTFATITPESFGHEVEMMNVRYFVQPIDGSKSPEQVFEDREQGRGGVGTIMPDGSVLLQAMKGIVWAKAGEAGQVEELAKIGEYEVYPVALYSDGIVGQEYRPCEHGARTWWIPIEGHALKMESRVQLDVGLESRPIFARHEGKIAWLNAPSMFGDTPKSKRKKPMISSLDVASGKVSSAAAKVEPGASLSAFDGTHGIGGGMLIDVASGEAKRFEIPGEAIGMAGDSVYMIKSDYEAFRQGFEVVDIVSVALDHVETPKIVGHIDLKKLKGDRASGWIVPRDCVLFRDDELRVWDGEHWAAAKQ
jgi:hypothetical protein